MVELYSFRDVRPDDMPRLRAWLRAPEVVRWWGDPDEQAAMLEFDMTEPRMAMRLVCLDETPFAYAQDYPIHAWPQAHLAGLPPGSRAIDSFIGEPEMIGRGHGSAYLRRLAARLLDDGASVVAIDPAVDNMRARRAYEKAGFVGDRVVETQEGPAVLMIFEPRASGVCKTRRNDRVQANPRAG